MPIYGKIQFTIIIYSKTSYLIHKHIDPSSKCNPDCTKDTKGSDLDIDIKYIGHNLAYDSHHNLHFYVHDL